MTRRGATIVEMTVVLVIIGILANIAIPAGTAVKRRADAARVIADFNTIRAASLDYFAEKGTFPRTGRRGRVPRELVSSLPGGFKFRYRSVTYRWRRWSLPNGLPRNRRQTVLVGLEIRTRDTALLQSIKKLYRGQLAFGRKRKVVFVIQ